MEASTLLERFRVAGVATERAGAQPTSEGDAFLATLTDALKANDIDRLGAVGPFDLIRADLERLRTQGHFDLIMMTAHALAHCLLESLTDSAIPGEWLTSDHPSVRTCAVATYSKVAEYVSSLDVGSVLSFIPRLVTSPGTVDDVTISFVGQLGGKLRGQPTGVRLIEMLARHGELARMNAAYAIAYDRELDPPVRYFSALLPPAPETVRSEFPPRRLIWLLLALEHDDAESVREAARQAIAMIVRKWPELARGLAEMSMASGHGTVSNEWIGPPDEETMPGDLESTLEAALAELSARTGRAWTRDNLATITRRDLDRSMLDLRRPAGVEFALRYPTLANERAGFLTWDPRQLGTEILANSARDDAVDIEGSPRLFLSYRWSQSIDINVRVDHYASMLATLGYDVVFDRDPRYLDMQLTATDALLLLPGCTHFVPFITQELLEFVARHPREPLSALDLEWRFASELRERSSSLRWLGIWLSGHDLPAPLSRAAVSNVRNGSLSLGPLFPECRFRVVSTARDGTRHQTKQIRRRQLSEAIAVAKARREVVSVEVRDVTRRDAVWAIR
jgi:hypothetical protein